MKKILVIICLPLILLSVHFFLSYQRALPTLLNTEAYDPYYVVVKELENNDVFYKDLESTLQYYGIPYFKIMNNIYFKGDDSDISNYTEHILGGKMENIENTEKEALYKKCLLKYISKDEK